MNLKKCTQKMKEKNKIKILSEEDIKNIKKEEKRMKDIAIQKSNKKKEKYEEKMKMMKKMKKEMKFYKKRMKMKS